MVVAFRAAAGSTTGANDTQSNPRVVNKPSGAVENDVATVAIEFWSANNATITVTPATGFVEFASVGPFESPSGGFIWLKLFKKPLGAGEPSTWSFAFTGGSGVWSLGHSVAVEGADTSSTNIEVVNTATGTTTAIPTTTVSPATAAGLLHFASRSNGGTQTTPPTNFTPRQSGNVLNSNTYFPNAPGTYPASGGVISVSTGQIAILVAIKPAAPSGSTGTLSGSLPIPSAAVAGAATASGALSGALPTPAAALGGQAVGSGLLAVSLPTPLAAVAGTAVAAGAFVVVLPTTEAGFTAQARASGTIAGALPLPDVALGAEGVVSGDLNATLPLADAELSGITRNFAELAGALPAPEVAFTGAVETEENLLIGVLSLPVVSLTGEAGIAGELMISLASPEADITGEAVATSLLMDGLPLLEAQFFGLALEPGGGQLLVTLPKLVSLTGRMQQMKELEAQRQHTREFIAASPLDIVLIPNSEERTASGAMKMVEGVARPVQRMRLIPMSHTERPRSSLADQGGGVQRKYEFTLLGESDSIMAENDYFYGPDGEKYIIDALVPFNGYQRKGLVMAYGRRARHG